MAIPFELSDNQLDPVIINADDYSIYEGIVGEIEGIVDHWIVNHSEKEWARGSAHVNGCENRNQSLKAYLKSIFTAKIGSLIVKYRFSGKNENKF